MGSSWPGAAAPRCPGRDDQPTPAAPGERAEGEHGTRRRLALARAATMVVLFVLAVVLGSWAPRVPQVKSDLGLGDGQLGLALLGAPSGAVASLWLAGLAVTRVGSAAVVGAGRAAEWGVGGGGLFVAGHWSLLALVGAWG
ncbi:hypothetical protein MXD58_026855, partial [Frankia sp. AgKG'84/4]|nr:hypothetical protein [Frankia sp. AgKG'84/4]